MVAAVACEVDKQHVYAPQAMSRWFARISQQNG
jgi:hypothetical protein